MIDQVLDYVDVAAKNYPIKALADELGKGESTLRGELNRQPGHKLGVPTFIRILKKTGDLRALHALCAYFGLVAYALPKFVCGALGPVAQRMGRLTKEFGEHMEALGTALEDGELSPEEAALCAKEAGDVIAEAVKLQALLEELAKKKS